MLQGSQEPWRGDLAQPLNLNDQGNTHAEGGLLTDVAGVRPDGSLIGAYDAAIPEDAVQSSKAEAQDSLGARRRSSQGAFRSGMRLLGTEVAAFGIVGIINITLEIGLYQLFYASWGLGALSAKTVTAAITTTSAYFMHRYWSFRHRGRQGLHLEYIIFAVLSVGSMLIGVAMIALTRYGLGRDDVLSLQLTNIAAIGIGAVFRFWAYRKWVFVAPGGRRADAVTERSA